MINNKNFHALDIYSRWKKSIKTASSKVYIISPYVDSTVKRLLLSENLEPNIEKQIYTRIDSDTIFDKPYQLKALIDCHKAGIEIFQIDELHAKILLIDESKISIGSQNFTSRGRKNKETSFISDVSFKGSKLLIKVKSWIENSNRIELEYLEELYSNLKKFIPKIKKLRKEHQIEFNLIKNKFDKKRLERLRQKLEEQRNKSLIKFASEYIYVSKKNINYLWTLKADEYSNLTLWKSDSVDLTKLSWLSWYPMMIVETGKLIFVRLASTRISFYSTGVTFGRKFQIGNKLYQPKINFIQDTKDQCNLELILKDAQYTWKDDIGYIKNEQVLKFFFDGEKCEFLDSTFSDEENERRIKNKFLKDKEIEKFMKEYLKSVSIEGYGAGVNDYFKNYRYKLYIIQYLQNPLLVCEKVW